MREREIDVTLQWVAISMHRDRIVHYSVRPQRVCYVSGEIVEIARLVQIMGLRASCEKGDEGRIRAGRCDVITREKRLVERDRELKFDDRSRDATRGYFRRHRGANE